jgi:hypothetical protein
LGHPMNISLKAYNIQLVLFVHAPMVYKFFACLVQEKIKYKVSAFFFESTY